MKRILLLTAGFIFFIGNLDAQTLVASYPFNGNTQDESTNANDGTNNGAKLTRDRFGNANSAYLFDGSDDFISFGNDPSLDIRDGFSISLWYFRTVAKYSTLIGRGYAEDGDFSIDVNTAGTVILYIEGTSYSTETNIANGWNHLTATYQTGTNGVKFYLNGTLVKEFTVVTDLAGASAYNFHIGNDDRDDSYFTAGVLDDVSMYDGILSPSQVSSLNEALPILVADFPFNGNAVDESGYGNNGVVSGATLTEDRFGNPDAAYTFSGTDFINFGNDVSLDIRDGMTFAAWFKTEVTDVGGNPFQSILGRGWANDGDYWLATYYNGENNVLRYRIEGEVTNGSVPINKSWNHVAFVVESGTDNVKLYLNGVLELSETTAQDLVGTSIYNFHIGNDDLADFNFFEGELDDIKVFQGALTGEQISDIIYAEDYFPIDDIEVDPDFGNALDFGETTESWVNVPATTWQDLTSFSFETWVDYNGSNPAVDGNMFYAGIGAGDCCQFYSVGVEGIRIDEINSFGRFRMDYAPAYNDGWNHFAFVVDATDSTSAVYINGQEISTTNYIHEGSHPNPDQTKIPFFPKDYSEKIKAFLLGRDESSSNYFNGALEETRIWNYALSKEEINSRMNIPLDGNEEGLVYYFDYNQGIPGGSNPTETTLLEETASQDAALFGFSLEGDDSNWIEFINTSQNVPKIFSLDKKSSTPGEALTIYGQNFVPKQGYTKVFIGGSEAEILSYTRNTIKVTIPSALENFSQIKVFTSLGVSEPFDFSIISNGGINFTFQERKIKTDYLLGSDITPADMNGDGFIDLVASSTSDQTDMLIFFNDEADLLDEGYEGIPFAIPGSTAKRFKSVNVIDLNGDGKLDILTNYYDPANTIEWYDNENGFAASSIALDDDSFIYPGDLDVDGDIDIAVISRDSLFWYQNDGNGNFSTTINETISTEVGMTKGVREAIVIADMDGDSDHDIILGSNEALTVNARLFINDGGGNFSEQIIGGGDFLTFLGFEVKPEVVDFDNDGDFDILFSGPYAQVWLFTNQGDLNFDFTEIVNDPWSIGSVNSGDLDGDGHIDFAMTWGNGNPSDSYNTFWWAKNGSIADESGIQPLFEVNQIASDFFAAGGFTPKVRNADLDNDGDLDLITISEFDNQIITYESVFTDNLFTSFSLSQQVGEAQIDSTTSSVVLTVENGTNLDELIPQFTISANASIAVGGKDQVSGLTINNFTNAVSYQITSESGELREWSVQVVPLPEIPQIISITDIGQTTATVRWNATSFTDSYETVYSTDEFVTEVSLESTSTSATLTLEPGLEYKVKVRSVNQYGVSASYSDEVSFVAIPPTPDVIEVEEVATTSTIITWEGTTGAEAYVLEIGKDSTFTSYVTGYNSKSITVSEENVFGLQAGTNYWVRIRSRNESGVSPASDLLSFITLANSPMLTFGGVTQTDFTASWNQAQGASSFHLEINDDEAIELDAAITTYTVQGLEAGSTSSVRIRSENTSGTSDWSDYQEVTTIPANPSISSISEITEVAAVAFWEETQGTSGYILDVARDANFTNFIGGYGARRVSALSESIIGLTAGTTYFARLRSANDEGTSDFSEVTQFLTKPKTPVFTQSTVSFDQITFAWSKDKGEAGFEILSIVNGDSTTTTFGSQETDAVFTELLPSTLYQFAIRSFNTSGSSDYSVPITITTVPAAVSTVSLEEVGQSEVALAWTEVDGANDYLLEISDNGFSTNISGYNPKTIAGTSEIVENLSSGTDYEARIRASNESGPSQYSETFAFTTVPANPVARDASNITSTSFNANWDNVEGQVDFYEIEVAIDENFSERIIISQTEALTTAISGLKEGVSHWYRIVAGNGSGKSGYSNVISVIQNLEVSSLSFDANPIKGETSSIPVSFRVSGGTNFHQVTFRYRRALGETWTERTLSGTNNDYAFTIESSFLDDVGLEFEIVVDDGETIVRSSENYIYWNEVAPEVSTISLSNQWQLFSIPYVLDDPQVGAIFDEMLAFKYKSQWRLMHYNGQNYLDANGGGIAEIELGEGYWFYTTENVTIDIGAGSVNTETPFTMKLIQGWNQIGNPFNVNIDWNSVLSNNRVTGIVEEALAYDASSNSFFEESNLEPFSGAFVWSNTEVDVEISLTDDISNGRVAKQELPSANLDADIWALNLQLDDGSRTFDIATIGMHPQASESRDIYDRVTLPRFLDYTEMYTVHSDYFHPYFRRDVRPKSETARWHFSLASNKLNGGVLTWDNSQLTKSASHLWLVDEENGQVIHMNTTNSYAAGFRDSYSLSIHLTENDTPPLPISLLVGDPFPNPTRTKSNILLTLPEGRSSYSITLKIVDLSGRTVTTLTQGSYLPGRYQFETDFENLAIESGVYFYQLEADGLDSFTVSKKIILTK